MPGLRSFANSSGITLYNWLTSGITTAGLSGRKMEAYLTSLIFSIYWNDSPVELQAPLFSDQLDLEFLGGGQGGQKVRRSRRSIKGNGLNKLDREQIPRLRALLKKNIFFTITAANFIWITLYKVVRNPETEICFKFLPDKFLHQLNSTNIESKVQ